MPLSKVLRWLLLASTLGFTAGLHAQSPPATQYEPSVGQEGKDVVWVPTPQALVDRMLDIGKVTAKDYLIDLGSGDGRTVITAARRGARALGIEYNPDMVALARRNAEQAGVGARARFMKADLFETDFSKATVVTMFLLPEINIKLRPKILDLRPGTRIVSNSFDMGDWEADRSVTADHDCSSYCRAFLWIVPAKVEGTWRWDGGELKVGQSFQMISGVIRTGARDMPISGGRVNGDQMTFNAGGARYMGRVEGDAIKGTVVSGSKTEPWTARR